jgi:MYXO-CTERM domain-containing protein
MPRLRTQLLGILALLGVSLSGGSASATGVYVGKNREERLNHSTHVVLMKKDATTVVTIMMDYEGPLEPFAIVTVVPPDVTSERLKTLRREFVDRVDKITAPRFHEFWEMEPCDAEPLEQEWERSMRAATETDFLGGSSIGPTKKLDKELFLDVDTNFKEGEFVFIMPAEGETVSSLLAQRSYQVPEGLEKALAPYLALGMKPVVIEVDPKRIELVGGERAQLSPFQYYTEQPFDSPPVRLALESAPKNAKQELIVYALHPSQRFESTNYPNVFPPTNVQVDFKVKERMGEFYAGLHDMLLAKNPKAFLVEYAWPAQGCGQPCATEPLMIHELLTLGGSVFELSVPEEEKNPEAPPLSEKEEEELKAASEGLKPKEKRERRKMLEDDKKTVVVRRALVERHKYVLSRLHHRYDANALPNDPSFAPAQAGVQGGTSLPDGPKGVVSTDIKQGDTNRFQVRYNFLHPSKVVANCDNPQRFRWGKAPRHYRGLRKVWVAEDLTRKDRRQIIPASVVMTPVPELGLVPAAIGDAGAEAGPDAGAGSPQKSSSCGCRVGRETGGGASLIALAIGLAALFGRRRR